MKKFVALTSLLMSSMLVACTYGNPVGAMQDTRVDSHNLPENFSLLLLGRTISNGSVDIYDPWLTSFDILPPPTLPEHLLADYPLHRTTIVRDSSVSLYDMPSLEYQDSLIASPLGHLDGIEIPDEQEVLIDSKQLPP
jgi:hypothetical protein